MFHVIHFENFWCSEQYKITPEIVPGIGFYVLWNFICLILGTFYWSYVFELDV